MILNNSINDFKQFHEKTSKKRHRFSKMNKILMNCTVGLGGLGVTCSPRDPRFAGSNPTEVDGFFQNVKILSKSPPGGTLNWGSRV